MRKKIFAKKPKEIHNFRKAWAKFKKEFLEKAIARNSGNIVQTAKDTGLSRPAIYDMIKKYDIRI